MKTDEISPEISKQNFNNSTIYTKDSKLWPRRIYPCYSHPPKETVMKNVYKWSPEYQT